MAHSEACQLFIEEQIKEGLAEGKTPYSIGKELTTMIERLFEASIPGKTLEKRAQRIEGKIKTNVFNPPTPANNLESPENQVLEHGGKREGAGRPQKFFPSPEPYSDAMYFATIALSQLSRIRDEDPQKDKALITVLKWIKEKLPKEKKHINQHCRGHQESCPALWPSFLPTLSGHGPPRHCRLIRGQDLT